MDLFEYWSNRTMHNLHWAVICLAVNINSFSEDERKAILQVSALTLGKLSRGEPVNVAPSTWTDGDYKPSPSQRSTVEPSPSQRNTVEPSNWTMQVPMCASCYCSFTDYEWDMRHSDADGENVHEGCCDVCHGDDDTHRPWGKV